MYAVTERSAELIVKKLSLLLALLFTADLMPVRSMTAPYSGYPYLYEDFAEKAESAVSWANAEYQSSSEGYGKSVGSLKITVGGDGQMIRIPDTSWHTVTQYIKTSDINAFDEYGYCDLSFGFFSDSTCSNNVGGDTLTCQLDNFKVEEVNVLNGADFTNGQLPKTGTASATVAYIYCPFCCFIRLYRSILQRA